MVAVRRLLRLNVRLSSRNAGSHLLTFFISDKRFTQQTGSSVTISGGRENVAGT